ncbi:MAG: hypothetical protein HY254_23190 [Burkholderiales bacterium]|nr:hypothetical protein [Burkholderiales bacterium]
MKHILIAAIAYSAMTLSGFALLAHMQIQSQTLQTGSGLIILVIAASLFIGVRPTEKTSESGFGFSAGLLAAASLSSLMCYQACSNGWLKECVLALIFTCLMQVLIALPFAQRLRQKYYATLIMSLQKLLALILIFLAVQDLLSGMSAQFSTTSRRTRNLPELYLS